MNSRKDSRVEGAAELVGRNAPRGVDVDLAPHGLDPALRHVQTVVLHRLRQLPVIRPKEDGTG